MANLTIRNLDDKVVRTLKAQAKAHNRSLEAELRRILEEAATLQANLTAFREKADRIRARTSGRLRSDSTQLIREDRDR